ncbi:ATP-dependent DNA ligase [Actinoplanes auranticolor]|nr:hypothetical protein [Actinoplanes auranticolor]
MSSPRCARRCRRAPWSTASRSYGTPSLAAPCSRLCWAVLPPGVVCREAAARRASLVLFDVLADAGLDLTGRPLRHRRTRLEDLHAGAPAALAGCPQTQDVDLARVWFDELAVTGVDVLVVKDLDGLYRPGRAGWWKLKRRVTTEAIIGAVDDPRVLLLGRLDDRGLRPAPAARGDPS